MTVLVNGMQFILK